MNGSSSNVIRVLLVDDESAILRSLERVLVEHELEIETATCAAEADALLDRYRFDVVVCDHNMPGRTGLEFLADVKTKRPGLITMMLSGQIDGVTVAQDWANQIGVYAVYAKPFDASVIAEQIKSAVQVKRAGEKADVVATT